MKKHWCIGIGALIFLGGTPVWAQGPWHIPAAEARFEMQITSRPTTPAAGIVAVLPDAGILPKGKLKADVVDEAGKPLKANLLWHNPNEGLALVFEDCPSAQVLVYVSSSVDYPKATASLHPSLLLFVRNGGKPDLDQAHALAEKIPVGPDMYFTLVDRIFHSLSPVGHDEQTSSYYSGWIQVKKAGKTYFYTVSKDGSEFSIDGKSVFSWPGVHGRAGGEHAEKGAWIDLSAGLHRLEYYYFTQTFLGRECQLGWQPAGEAQPRNPKNPNLPNLGVTATMEEDAFVHSGVATLAAASAKQGGPLAIFNHQWEAILQPGQTPVCVFKFNAFGSDRLPTNTVYEWDFGGDRKLQGPQVAWLYGGMGDQRVTLTVSTGRSKSTCSRTFFPKSLNPAQDPPRLSINRAEDRREVRELFLAMCRATPAGRRPGELWNATLWEGLAAAMDSMSEYALLSQLFERSRQDILGMDDTRRWLLEDAFYEALHQVDPKATVAWLDRFEKEEKAPARIGQWKARRVEFYIFEADNLGQARLAANEFIGAAAGLKQTELAMIRMGDVELFNGHHDLAQRFYAQAQESSRRPATPDGPLSPAKPDQKKPGVKTGTKPPDGKAAGPAEKKSGRQPAGVALKKSGSQLPGKETPLSDSAAPPGTLPAIDAWKITAVRGSSFYATVRNLIGQQAYSEARKTLDQWELELPLDKLAGDFALAEAEYYMALKQFKRAQKILMTYRQSVDLSNTLPQAMKMELYCLTQLNRDKEARDLAGVIIKRLPNHPLAEEVKSLLASAEKTGKLEVDLDAWSREWTASEKVDSTGLSKLFGTKEIKIKSKPARARKSEESKPAAEDPAE